MPRAPIQVTYIADQFRDQTADRNQQRYDPEQTQIVLRHSARRTILFRRVPKVANEK